jgi:hypothetical protein
VSIARNRPPFEMPPPGPPEARDDRVRALKALLERRAYEVPSEDVAARIIRDALAGVPPAEDRH